MRACRQLAARGMMVPQGGPQPHRQCRRADRRSKRPSRHSPVGHPRTGGPRRGRSIASPATTMARPEKGISPHSRPASGTKPWHGRGGTKHGLPGIPESRRRATQQNDPLVPFAARGRSKRVRTGGARCGHRDPPRPRSMFQSFDRYGTKEFVASRQPNNWGGRREKPEQGVISAVTCLLTSRPARHRVRPSR